MIRSVATEEIVAHQQNRSLHVFVSSTFRDMKEEQDALTSHTWPALRQFCRQRQVGFVEVDLRWGIAESQGTRNEILRLCLLEIRAYRPYFLGLMDRTGVTDGHPRVGVGRCIV